MHVVLNRCTRKNESKARAKQRACVSSFCELIFDAMPFIQYQRVPQNAGKSVRPKLASDHFICCDNNVVRASGGLDFPKYSLRFFSAVDVDTFNTDAGSKLLEFIFPIG